MSLKERILKKSNLWHVGAVAAFLIIACIYFYPALDGYKIDQDDVQNWAGSSQEIKSYMAEGEQVKWTNSIFSGMPSTQIMMQYEGKQIPEFFRSAMSLWLPAPVSILFVYFIAFYIMALSFRIKPLIAVIGAIAYGFSSYFIIILEVGHITKALAIGYAPLVVAGFVMTYRYKNWLLGVGLSALFMTFLLTANHVQIAYYLAFVLIALGIVEFFRLRKEEKGLIRFAKYTGGIVVAYALALMINIGNIKGSAEYVDQTMRGGTELTIDATGAKNENATTDGGLDRDYVTHWSYGKAETFTFLVPNYKGGMSVPLGSVESNEDLIKDVDGQYRQYVAQQSQYFGDQPFTSGGVYVGAIVFLLAILALIYSDRKSKWALFAVTMLAIMLAWGKNFMFLTDLFLDYFPGYNKFRAVTIILFLAELCVPLLGVFFLAKLVKAREEIAANIKPFLITSGSVIGLLLLFLAIPSAFNTFISEAESAALDGVTDPRTYDLYSEVFTHLENVRISIFRKDVLRSLFFVVTGAGLMYAFIRGFVKELIMLAGVGVLTLADLALVDRRFLNTEEEGRGYKQWVEAYRQELPFSAGAGENEIMTMEINENPELFLKIDSARVAVESTFDKEMSGGEKQRRKEWAMFRTLNRYTHFRVLEEGNLTSSSYVPYFFKSIGGYHGAKLGRYQELIEFHMAKGNPAVYDMLNMKYVIRPQRDQNGLYVGSQLVRVNPTAMGNAWFAKDVEKVESADAEIIALTSSHAYTVEGRGGIKVLVNGQPHKETDYVLEGESIAVLFPNPADSTGMRLDTIPVQVPFQASVEMEITWYVDSTGQPNWQYDLALDTNVMKIITVGYKGREGWDPAKTTFYRGDQLKDSYSGEGSIELISYHPDNLKYSTSSTSDQLAVFSEMYYPVGWKAYVDNQEVEIHRVNYALRAVEVPAGEHTVELVYELESYNKSGTMALIGSIIVLLLLMAGVYIQCKRQPEVESADIA